MFSRRSARPDAGLGVRRQANSESKVLDFDEEARKLWARLDLEPSRAATERQHNPLDPLWRHPVTGATLFVGNQRAAADAELLAKFGIARVLNCTTSIPNYHEKPGGPIQYYSFNVCSHRRVATTDEKAVAFAQPMLDWVEDMLARGENVMAHCLAGAHRAGTTGVICLMHFAGLSADEAVKLARSRRPIIEPISHFADLLEKLERSWKAKAAAAAAAPGVEASAGSLIPTMPKLARGMAGVVALCRRRPTFTFKTKSRGAEPACACAA